MAQTIRAVSQATGISVYLLKKMLAQGDITQITVDDVFEYQRREAIRNARMTEAEVLAYFRHDEGAFHEALANGAIMPLVDGRYLGRDLVELTPHRFALLPPHPAYTPTRPEPNLPIEWNPVSALAKANFKRAFESRQSQSEFWTHDGVNFYAPDGIYCASRVRGIRKTMRASRLANAPLYAPDVVATPTGQAERVKVQGYTTPRATVVNLSVMDDYGVWAHSHGVYNAPEAWVKALQRAVHMLGMAMIFDATDTIDSVMGALASWLDTAV
jgi:hypothetical protein